MSIAVLIYPIAADFCSGIDLPYAYSLGVIVACIISCFACIFIQIF